MSLVAFMLSNRPDTAFASMQHYSEFDKVYIYSHENQKMDFDAAWQEVATNPTNVGFLSHNISRVKGQPPFGAIRYHLFQNAQSIIGRRDFAVMVDDDLKQPRWAKPGNFQKSGAQSYPLANPTIFCRELIRVAQEARKSNFHFFTGVPNARAHNGYKSDSPFKAVWRFSQLLGFFKDSPNPFDPKISAGEDYAASCKLVDELGTLPFLEHRGFVPEFEIIATKYQKAADPRNILLNKLKTKRYPWLELNNNYVSGVIAPRMNRKFLNNLKHTVSKQYR